MQRRGRSPSVSMVAVRRQEQQQTGHLSLVTVTPAPEPPLYTTPTSSLKPLSIPVAPGIDTTNQVDCVYPPSPSQSPPTSGSMTPIHGAQECGRDSPEPGGIPPPLTLQDQLHVAYALDDIHLAKILLLKLKGIEVTSDSDPRIAAVKPEDFDECFIPAGGLMSAEDEEAIKEMQRAERERFRVENEQRKRREHEEAEQRRRRDWESHCEKIWEGEKKRLREEKEFLEKKREEERRKWEDSERRRRVRDKEAAERRTNVQSRYSARSSTTKSKLSYAGLSAERSESTSSSSSLNDKYLYSFMPIPKVPPPPRRRRAANPTTSIDNISPPFSSSFSNSSTARRNQQAGTSLTHNYDSNVISEAEKEPSVTPPRPMLAYSPSTSLQSDDDDDESSGRIQSPSLSLRNSNVTVSFRDVLTSMRGPLFPVSTESADPRYPCAGDAGDIRSHSRSPKPRSRSRGQCPEPSLQALTSAFIPSHQSRKSVGQGDDARRRKQANELLESLLVEVTWTDGGRMPRGRPLCWGDEDGRDKENQTESKSKKKLTLPPQPTRQNSTSSIRSTGSRNSRCAACSAASASSNSCLSPTSPTLSSSSSSGALTRAGSWLSSFSSSSSSSTNITTPSTSLSTSPIKASVIPHSHVHFNPSTSVKATVTGWLRKSAIAAAANQQHSKDCSQQHNLVHSCHHRLYSRLTPIMASDGPLSLENNDETLSKSSVEVGEDDSDAASGSHIQSNVSDRIGSVGAAGIARQMTRFVELARGFQTAYINMTVFAAVPTVSSNADAWDREFRITDAGDRGRLDSNGINARLTVLKKRLRPVGYRASRQEVEQFVTVPTVRKEVFSRQSQEAMDARTSTSSSKIPGNHHAAFSLDSANEKAARNSGRERAEVDQEEIVYIPLVSPFPPTHPPKTILPSPLPYPLVFKPPLPITLSPHRRAFIQQNRQTFEDAMEFGSLSVPSSSTTMKGTGRFSTRLSSSPPPRASRSRRNGSRSSSHSPTRRSQRDQKQVPPTPMPIARPRLVANPVYLRLKALKNVGYEQGLSWEPNSSNKSCGTLHGGKEKVLTLAWDEVGRSALGCQIEEVNRRQSMIDFDLRIGREVGISRRGRSAYSSIYDAPAAENSGAVRRGRCVFRG
ncbi:hypothetical protein WG66_015902 [Moniliophthora roreri]|nr:hypothetical protein WG66_015902 [Moniliophthora roreri]